MIVGKTDVLLDGIHKSVWFLRRVTDIMGEISSASLEQRTGIEQVNQAVSQMDEVTQQNAALVEEASAAAQSMAYQSNELREVVSIFTLPANSEPPVSVLPQAKEMQSTPVHAQTLPARANISKKVSLAVREVDDVDKNSTDARAAARRINE